MKKYTIFAVVSVLTLTLLAGCRKPMEEPTIIPTTPATILPTVAPETRPVVPETSENMADTIPTDGMDATVDVAPTGETGTIESRQLR